MAEGGHAWQGACVAGGVYGRRDGHCSGRYASHWNAFLLDIVSVGLNVNELDTLQLICSAITCVEERKGFHI